MKSTSAPRENITRQLKVMDRKQKPKMLVVDDEPDNLDLLYRTFRRDFRVFKAHSGIDALEVLANEGEVAVIISDQRMPEMKGTEFLSKTVPDFPDTVRIILTGFTDVEDLVDAINSGQVYKYITKPWDPNELKIVVDRAAETYDILKQRNQELGLAHLQTQILAHVVQVAQEFDSLESSLEPMVRGIGEKLRADGCILNLVTDKQLSATFGSYFPGANNGNTLTEDPLAAEAIAAGETQVWADSTSARNTPSGEYYQDKETKAHIVVPIVFREKLLALLSVQWYQIEQLLAEEVKILNFAAQQIALALTTIECG